MTEKMMKRLITVCAVILAAGGAAQATSTNITVTGRAESNMYGYTAGSSYSFTWVVNNDFVNNGNCRFTADRSNWQDEDTTQTPVFTSVSGDGLFGTYVRPTQGAGDPYEQLIVTDNTLNLLSSSDSDYPVGLTANGVGIKTVQAGNLAIAGFDYAYPLSYMNPGAYFTARAGTYNSVTGFMKVKNVDGDYASFVATSVTIGSSGGSSPAVPEPAFFQMGAMLGMSGLGCLKLRRKA